MAVLYILMLTRFASNFDTPHSMCYWLRKGVFTPPKKYSNRPSTYGVHRVPRHMAGAQLLSLVIALCQTCTLSVLCVGPGVTSARVGDSSARVGHAHDTARCAPFHSVQVIVKAHSFVVSAHSWREVGGAREVDGTVGYLFHLLCTPNCDLLSDGDVGGKAEDSDR